MSLKNGVKTTVKAVKCVLDNDYIITLVGQLEQTCTKTEIALSVRRTTPGGRIIEEYDNVTVEGLTDNEGGICKSLYMGWSVCQPEDKNVYDFEKGVRYAKKHFSRPIITHNFTYLNKDQIDCLMKNEIEYVIGKQFSNAKIVEYTMIDVD